VCVSEGDGAPNQPSTDCHSHNYEALAVGCGGSHGIEFRSTCAQQSTSGKCEERTGQVNISLLAEYSCHGSWEENGISYVIASPVARKSTDVLRYCFIYTLSNQPETTVIEGSLGKKVEPPVLRLSGVSESCHRNIIPGVTGNWAFNFTSNGKGGVSNLGKIQGKWLSLGGNLQRGDGLVGEDESVGRLGREVVLTLNYQHQRHT
jgi:hypothetical protein